MTEQDSKTKSKRVIHAKSFIENLVAAGIVPPYCRRIVIDVEIDNIVKISVVAGEFDIVVRVHIKSLEILLKVTDKIQMIKGVNKTTTQVIEKEIAL